MKNCSICGNNTAETGAERDEKRREPSLFENMEKTARPLQNHFARFFYSFRRLLLLR